MDTLSKNDAAATPYWAEFQSASARYGVDWRLLAALAFVESSFNPRAINQSDNRSIGLMQVLCRPDGRGGCKKLASDFPEIDRSLWCEQLLFVPGYNIIQGTIILAAGIKRYGVKKGVAVYNSLAARNAPDAGPFPNQVYVDNVMSYATRLGMVL